MRADSFTDYERYVEYFNSEPEFLYRLQGYNTVWSFISGEVLWNVLIISLTELFGDARYPLRFFSWVIFVLWAYIIIRRTSFLLALLFLVNPIVIDVAMSGIRNGLAWSVFFFAVYEVRSRFRFFLAFATVFIHTSSIFLCFLYLVYLFRRSRIQTLSHFDMYYGFALGSFVMFGSSIVMNFLPDRRLVDYVRGDISAIQPLYFVFILILFVVLCSRRKFYFTTFFGSNIIGLYLAFALFLPWAYRVWGAAIPLMALFHYYSFRRYREFVLFTWFFYTVIWYVYWSPFLTFLL